MCGITGEIYSDRNQMVNKSILLRMCESIKHRGPDDQGIFVDGHVGLGMRRLAIIDL